MHPQVYPFISKICSTFVAVHSNRLMKKGGGIGPLKPWQPLWRTALEKGANSDPIRGKR